jgi:ornithine carbamoyltransferase
MRHVLSLLEMTPEEIEDVLDLAAQYKSRLESGDRPQLLAGHTVGLLFEKPSLRTRVSFEALTTQLGGNSLFLGEDVGWGVREPLCDFMPILTSYIDLLVIRAKSHAKVEEAVSYSRCPVINGLTDISHPCQAFADMLTIRELAGSNLANSHVTYVGDANNVAYSLALICSKLGIRMSIAAPQGYQFEPSFVDKLNEFNNDNLIRQTDNIAEAVDQANFIYTDVWTSMGQEAESKKRLQDFADYQVNDALMGQAAENAKFLHCLPARRGEEVASEVIDSDRSAIVQQANNRLHAQKGLVIWLLGKHSPNA